MDAFDRESVLRALRAQQDLGNSAGAAVAALRLEADRQIARALSEELQLAFVLLDTAQPEALGRLPLWAARRGPCCPVSVTRGQLVVAFADPTDAELVAWVGTLAGMAVDPVVAARTDIDAALERWRTQMRTDSEPAPDHDADSAAPEAQDVIRVVNEALEEAVATGADEIHIEAERDGARIRLRRGGRFVTHSTLPRALLPALTGRVKVVASMDVAEHRLPQTASLRLRLQGRAYAMTVSTLPALWGEKIVIGVGAEAGPPPPLAELGLTDDGVARVRRVVRQHGGWLLVAGPGRSGRRTFTHAALADAADETRSAVSIEDARSRELIGVTQVMTRPDLGLTIASALRVARTQHADVVGCEVRDYETAEMCARAALEGVVVVGRVPTGNAVTGLYRLLDMGLEAYMMLESIALVQGQRLLRTLCADCKVAVPAERSIPAVAAELEQACGAVPAETFAPGSCARCHGDGYLGRIGVYEHLELAGTVREMFGRGAAPRELRREAIAQGMVPLRVQALRQVAAGRVSLADALAISGDIC